MIQSRFVELLVHVFLAGIMFALGKFHIPPSPTQPIPPPMPIPPIVSPIPPVQPPAPVPPAPPKVANAVQALCRFSTQGTGCTCTLLGPTPKPGYVAVLTANHCVGGRVGLRFNVGLKDGRKYEAICIAVDRSADCALGVIKTTDDLPFAKIAEKDPAPGTKVWQAGYGVGKPEKRYNGTVTGIGNAQTEMQIRFFSGDSGGGIFRDDTNELVSVVCCTNGPTGWGATVARIRAMIADAVKRYSDTDDQFVFPVEGATFTANADCPFCPPPKQETEPYIWVIPDQSPEPRIYYPSHTCTPLRARLGCRIPIIRRIRGRCR